MTRCLSAILLSLSLFSSDAIAQRKAEPLKSAWRGLVRTGDEAIAFQSMTDAQRYASQMKELAEAQKQVKGKVYSLRLQVIGVEPSGVSCRSRIQATYADEEDRDTFFKMKDIYIGADQKQALALNVGDEFEVQGKIYYKVNYDPGDVDKLPPFKNRPGEFGTYVAYLDYGLTRWIRGVQIYMVNPTIVSRQAH